MECNMEWICVIIYCIDYCKASDFVRNDHTMLYVFGMSHLEHFGIVHHLKVYSFGVCFPFAMKSH